MISQTIPQFSAPDTIAYLESLRNALRYAIEQMDDEERKMWLGM